MATVEISRRSIFPEARVVAPSGENSLAEQFGRSITGIGQAAAGAAADVMRADQIQEERAWQSEQPKIAKAIAESGANSAQAFADLKAKAPADLSGYKDAVGNYWDEQKAALLKLYPNDQRAQDYIDLHLTGMKGDDIARAVSDTTAAKVKVRGDSIQQTLDLGANTLTSDPGKYNTTMANVMATIDAQKGAVPEATLNEWRTQATNNLTAAMLGGQVERDPYAAKKQLASGDWDGTITPQQKVTLGRLADAGIQDRENEAKRAQADAEKAQHAQDAMKLSDLQIQVSRGQAGYQDVEKAYANGKGWLQPDDRARLTLAIDGRGQEQAKAQSSFNFVAGAKAGAYQVDPKSQEQMKAVNADYLSQVKLWTEPAYDPVSGQTTQRTPQQVNDLTLDYVKTLGVVPEALQGQLRGQIRNGSADQMAQAANTIEQMRQTNPALLDDFAKTDIERATHIVDQVSAGVQPAQAVNNVLAMQTLDKATADGRAQQYETLTKPASTLTRFQSVQNELQGAVNSLGQRYVPFVSNPDLPAKMVQQYDDLKKDAYLRTGDMAQAQKSALDSLKRVWGQSDINGAVSWMQSPPENFYAAPEKYALSPAQNSEWMKKQLVDEFSAGAAVDQTAGPIADRLTIVPTNKVDPQSQKPLYAVMFRDSIGNIGPAVTRDPKTGQSVPMLWAPDWTTSGKRKELDDAALKSLQRAKMQRDLGLGPMMLGQMSESQIRDLQGHHELMRLSVPQTAMPEAAQPDQLQSDELEAEPQSIAPPSFLQTSMRSASDDELKTLVDQAVSKSIREAATAELARRSGS